MAEVSDSPIAGIFSPELSDNQSDYDFYQFGIENLFGVTKGFKYNNSGAATLKLNRKAKTATITVKKNVKWSDGQPVVAKDVEYAYEILANKSSKSSRYTDSLQNIKGMAEYHAGTSKTISGITEPDGDNGKKVVLHFKQMKPGMKQSGNGYIWEYAEPYHYLKDVAFSDLAKSDKVRKNPLGFGPFKFAKVVSGQSVEFTRNKYYYKGTPKLSKVDIEVLASSKATTAIKSKKYDLLFGMPSAQYKNYKNAKGYTMISQKSLSYTYLGFNLGKYDTKTSENVTNKDSKMYNRSLRQAMLYALNLDEVAKKFYPGVRTRATTLIPPAFSQFHEDAKGYQLDLKKAKSLLDKAGYKKGKGGYRTDPKGKKLTIHFAVMQGDDTTDAMYQDFIQQWKKVGLRVKLTTGRAIEFNSFYDKVENNSSDIDVFAAAWSLGTEPSPMDLYSKAAPYNFSRFTSKENTSLLNKIDSEKSFNTAYRVKAFKEWQKYMLKEAPVAPLFYSIAVTPTSNRVKNYAVAPESKEYLQWQDVAVTSTSR
ncbi:oligopeptide ABC transporter substrate-binding protein [Lacticaseibacillus pantheris]|uniref:oligopeptide ABC transporter substrate-binding protein n=1 Tax=Lacticaseibacillus pantheris TaxID=171523 RepID=UPI0026598903|nr:oligopeptide ABC transporter substrate-binding protein [Lacticaseibacillus pantheris]WKF84527.1 oligopeptide ABC transporter substrate-binding protein [Lacticaseibacillus pantheris]